MISIDIKVEWRGGTYARSSAFKWNLMGDALAQPFSTFTETFGGRVIDRARAHDLSNRGLDLFSRMEFRFNVRVHEFSLSI